MKQTILIIAIMLFGINFYAQQTNTEKLLTKNHVLKTNVLGLFTFFYEHSIKDKSSFQVGLQYNPESLPVKDKIITSIAPEWRFYFKPKNSFPSGIFIAPYAKYQYLIDKKENPLISAETISADIQTIAIGGNMGYQMILKNNLTVELFIGAGYSVFKSISTDFSDNFADKDYNLDLRLGLGFGYAF